ncbi:Cj0069 family protein [Aureivirga sp. CE67]|uniref:Cj0069 family protein n=1 Tax=Aureivirga sp. CE67 TaxID=1788983 RepID=UPI0018C9CBD1|nr:Cj0069 family protein [Aureivirga sp. CE67]
MKKHIVIFEARGGTDKGSYGFRNDSRPIIDSLRKRGWKAEIIFYSDENRGEIYRHTVEKADAYISRVNPGNLPNETGYFQMLRELVTNGVAGLPHPDAMQSYGAKNSIEKLKGTPLVPEDVFSYYTFEEFKDHFPNTLLKGTRVVKQNRGSTGEGIWRVEVVDKDKYKDEIPLDAELKLTEAKDNHTEHKSLQEFLEFCIQYLEGENGMLLDMPFLERIVEGEIRVLMLRNTVVNIVHKKPANTPDAFSATLFSGAVYRYDKPEEWPDLVKLINKNISMIQDRLGSYDLPLIWTADFILDTDKKTKKDKYVLGEINASCVGFTTFLELSEQIADELVNLLYAENVVNKKWSAFKK